jgi:hypothetical protein
LLTPPLSRHPSPRPLHAGELPAATPGSRIGYRIKRGDDDDFLRPRSATGAHTRELLQMTSPRRPESPAER